MRRTSCSAHGVAVAIRWPQVQVGRLHARLPGQNHCSAQRALEERSRIGTAFRTPSLDSSRADLALLAAGCHD